MVRLQYTVIGLWWSVLSITYIHVCSNTHTDLYVTSQSLIPLSHTSKASRWLIPESLRLLIPDTYQCEILYTGVLKLPAEDSAIWEHGYGALRYASDIHTCLYMTHDGVMPGNPTDVPFTLSIAILCFVDFESEKMNICALNSDQVNRSDTQIRVYPKCYSELIRNKPSLLKFTSVFQGCSPPLLAQMMVRSLHFSNDQYEKQARYRAVCTVQTFYNELTGPMMYMFARFHLVLGWMVIVYDRFGMHEGFLRELMTHERFRYHPYTMLQLVLPDIYNDRYRNQQSNSGFLHYNNATARESSNPNIAKDNEEGNQNSDKRKTYMLARQQYSHVPYMLFVDRDEFFFCSGLPDFLTISKDKIGRTRQRQNAVKVVSSLSNQKTYQRKYFTEMVNIGVQRLSLPRVIYSPVLTRQAGDSVPLDDILFSKTVQCMRDAFASTNRRRSLDRMLGCWEGVAVEKKPFSRKSMDLQVGSACPIGGVHQLCIKCKCREYRPSSERCHLMHFSFFVSSTQDALDIDGRKLYFHSDYLNLYSKFKKLLSYV